MSAARAVRCGGARDRPGACTGPARALEYLRDMGGCVDGGSGEGTTPPVPLSTALAL